MSDLLNASVSIALAIIGVAFLAVLVSRNSNTTGVISASGNAFSGGLATALSPITGDGGFHVGNTMAGPGFYGF